MAETYTCTDDPRLPNVTGSATNCAYSCNGMRVCVKLFQLNCWYLHRGVYCAYKRGFKIDTEAKVDLFWCSICFYLFFNSLAMQVCTVDPVHLPLTTGG